MSRHSSSGSTHHRIQRERSDEYVISWTVDFYYPGTRGRFPRTFRRDTNEAGARRFAKRWKIAMPTETP